MFVTSAEIAFHRFKLAGFLVVINSPLMKILCVREEKKKKKQKRKRKKKKKKEEEG